MSEIRGRALPRPSLERLLSQAHHRQHWLGSKFRRSLHPKRRRSQFCCRAVRGAL